ncbi:hypothetical protein HanPSC8_Chr14g0622061 [Helianthus annuus]|nr:hypothetical protein HanPSC8_Chr14g0622061 [Helianthus annuus]
MLSKLPTHVSTSKTWPVHMGWQRVSIVCAVIACRKLKGGRITMASSPKQRIPPPCVILPIV